MRIVTHNDSEWGEVYIPVQQREYPLSLYLPTGEVFNLDPAIVVRTKCAALLFLTPALTLLRSIYWLAKSIFLGLCNAFDYLDRGHVAREDKIDLLETVSDVGRSMKFGLLMTLTAASGTIMPYRARLRYGRLERQLNRHADGPHRDKFYLAICFQPLFKASLGDPYGMEKMEAKLTKYVFHIDAMVRALRSGSILKLMDAFNTFRFSK